MTGHASATYSPYALVGGNSSYINEMVVRSTSNVLIDRYRSDQYGVTLGIRYFPNSGLFTDKISENFTTEPGSQISITNYWTGSTGQIIGGDAKYLDIGGKIDVDITTGSVGCVVGRTYSTITTERMLVRNTANITVHSVT